jgi:hypothetical protein
VWIKLQKFIQLLRIANGDENRASNARSGQLVARRLETAGIIPTVRSAKMPKKRYDRFAGAHLVAKRNVAVVRIRE